MSATPVFLSDEELFQATHRLRPSAQMRWLSRIGVRAERRPDGTLIVGRLALERALSGESQPLSEAANGLSWGGG